MRVFGYCAKIGQFCAVFGYYKTFTKNIGWLRGRVSMLSGSPFPSGVSLDTTAGGVSVAVPAPVGAGGVSLDCGGGNPAPVPVGGRAGIL